MPRVYISYRPEDSSRNEVAVIRQRLSDVMGAENVLESTNDSMETTVHVQRQVQSCDVLLVVIGRWWAQMVDEQGNYLLNNPYDPIHVEIYAGLKRRMAMKVLMVDGAPIPEASQLPEVLQPFLTKDIIEAPDDAALNRFLDAFVEQVSAMAAKATANKPRVETKPQVPHRPVEPKDNEQRRRELALGERVRRQSAQPPRPTTTPQAQNTGNSRYIGRIAIGLAVIVIGAVYSFVSNVWEDFTPIEEKPALIQTPVSDYPASIAEETHTVPQIATLEADATQIMQEVATLKADETLSIPTTTHLRLSPHTFEILSNQLAFSPDSRYLLAHHNVFPATTMFDILTQSIVDTSLPEGSYHNVQFVSDTQVAFFHDDGNDDFTFTVWDVVDDNPVIDAYPVDQLNMAYSRIFASNAGTEVIFITTDGKLMRWWVSSEAASIVKEVSFDYDESLQYTLDVDMANDVLSISDREQIRVYDLTTLDLIATMEQPDSSILYHAFMPDRGRLLLIDAQGDVSTWDYRDDTFEDIGQIGIVDKTRPYVRLRITYDPINQYIYTSYLAQYERIDVWDINTMQRLLHYGPPQDYDVISDLLVSPDGRYLASMNDTVLYTIQEE